MSSHSSDPEVSTLPTVPAEASTRTIGLPQATSLVVGTIIAVGRKRMTPPGPPPPVDALSTASVTG